VGKYIKTWTKKKKTGEICRRKGRQIGGRRPRSGGVLVGAGLKTASTLAARSRRESQKGRKGKLKKGGTSRGRRDETRPEPTRGTLERADLQLTVEGTGPTTQLMDMGGRFSYRPTRKNRG